MVVMPMTENKGVDQGWVNLKKIEIVEQGIRGIAEIDQSVPALAANMRLGMHGQSPLTNQLSVRGLLRRFGASKTLHGKIVVLLGEEVREKIVVRDDSYSQSIHLRDSRAERLGL